MPRRSNPSSRRTLAIGLAGALHGAVTLAATPIAVGDPLLRPSTVLSISASTGSAGAAPSAQRGRLQMVLNDRSTWSGQATDCATLTGERLMRLSLTDALVGVMCKSPAMRQALLAIQSQQASVALAEYAYRPQLSVNAELAANHTPSSNINASSDAYSLTTSLGLSWVLFDFGVRSANLEQARQSLASSLAGQDNAALATITTTLRTYTDAAAAGTGLEALREAEAVAASSLEVAQAKYDAQVGSLAEKLQAQTALAQARLDRVKAEGVWQAARGALAIAMGLPVSQNIGTAPLEESFPPTAEEPETDQLLAQAREVHPRLRSLRADIKSLQARLDSVRASGRGTVSFNGGALETRGLGADSGFAPDGRINGSVFLNIPLLNGPQQRALESQAVVQIGTRQADLEAAERDIELQIWRAAQQLRTETSNSAAARQLFDTASQGYRVALGRYKAGVGSIVELLTAQSALASARNQVNQAALASANARLTLSISTGRLGARP